MLSYCQNIGDPENSRENIEAYHPSVMVTYSHYNTGVLSNASKCRANCFSVART